MASFTDEAGRPDTGGTSGRRDFMRRAAVVSTGAFVAPTIITVDAPTLRHSPAHRPSHPDSRARPRATSAVPPAR